MVLLELELAGRLDGHADRKAVSAPLDEANLRSPLYAYA
jgi:hypothetical protein